MDQEDESAGFLKFFNDGPHNFLLHSTEDGLTDAFPVESIFTEITSDWPSREGLPILLSGALVADENNEESLSNNTQFYREINGSSPLYDDSNSNTVTFLSNIQVPENNIVASNNLIFSNDVLLQLKPQDDDQQENENILESNTVTRVINGDTYSITYTSGNQEEAAENEVDDNSKSSNLEVIQLLGEDGTITTINKDALDFVQLDSDPDVALKLEDFYSEVKANKCKFCPFLCETVEEIATHLSTEHEKQISKTEENVNIVNGTSDMVPTKIASILTRISENKYMLFLCSECGTGFTSKEDLKQHMISQHNLINVNDDHVEKTSDPKKDCTADQNGEKAMLSMKKTSANLLKKEDKAMRKIKCSIKGCPLRFAKDELRKRHEDCHVNQEKKQFMCPVCKQKFSVWRICSMHLWKCHSIDVGLLTCPMCNQFKSNSAVRVVDHMAIHNEDKPFLCKSCGKTFKQVNQLRNHEVIHMSPEDIPNWYSVKQCQFCDRYFANTKSLKKHIKSVHDKFKPFICNICGHQTARKSMLQLHYRQHTGDKPHQCSYCDYKTGDHNCLRKHTMRHFGAAKYSCPYCNYQSIQSSAYKIHLANKHPGKEGTYSCTTCSYTTINVASYLAHIKCHELEKKKAANAKTNKINEKPTNGEEDGIKSDDNKVLFTGEDDETQNCFLTIEHSEPPVDTGGITIPAGLDLQLGL